MGHTLGIAGAGVEAPVGYGGAGSAGPMAILVRPVAIFGIRALRASGDPRGWF